MPRAGIEPARPFTRPADFLTGYDFRRQRIAVCGLDYAFAGAGTRLRSGLTAPPV